jgi:hypothetical protein
MTFTRCKSARDDEEATKHKIAVFNRKSILSSGTWSVQDLEDFCDLDLDEYVPTSRIFSQDDCLHMEQSPLGSP